MTPIRSIDNDIYRRLGHAWWDEDVGDFSTLRLWINSVRFGYFGREGDPARATRTSRRGVWRRPAGGGIRALRYGRERNRSGARDHRNRAGPCVDVGARHPLPDRRRTARSRTLRDEGSLPATKSARLAARLPSARQGQDFIQGTRAETGLLREQSLRRLVHGLHAKEGRAPCDGVNRIFSSNGASSPAP